jgi:hypothetical protein
MNFRTSNILPQVASQKNPRNIFPRPVVASPSAPAKRGRGILALTALLFAAAGAQAQSVFPLTAVGTATPPTQTVTVTASAAGTVSTVEVLTGGASGLEFTQGSATVRTPCASTPLSVSNTCQVSVTFTPAYPGLRLGAVVLLDTSNDVLGTAYLSGVGQGGLNVLTPGNTIPVAGTYGSATGAAGPGDNGPATNATLDLPASVVLDGAGNIYIADSKNEEVRMVCFSTTSAPFPGITCSVAGEIVNLTSGVSLNLPSGVAVDGAGNLYIADTGNQIIRKITAATGAISTVAGDGTAGYRLSDDGGPATSAELNSPQGVTVDASGNLFIADTINDRIRRVDAVTGVITTAAGGGTGTGSLATDATLNGPYAVAFDAGGNMYIPDSGDDVVVKVAAVSGSITAASTISTVAGNGTTNATPGCPAPPQGATPLTTPLNTPRGVAVDPAANLYISDSRDGCVWKANVHLNTIALLADTGQNAVTLAGETANPLAASDLVQTNVYWPQGIFVDNTGDVYFADLYGMVIEEIQSNVAVADFLPTPVLEGQESSISIYQAVDEDGNTPSVIDSITAGTNAFFNPGKSNCGPPLPFTMGLGAFCLINTLFDPSTIGNPLEGNVYVAGNTPNDDNPAAPMNIILIGDGASFTISLSSNPNPSAFGAAVIFTAKVGAGSGVATGSVTFTDTINGVTTTLGTVTLAAGQAVYTTSALIVGVHTITATYGSNSTTATVVQTVYEGTATVLSAVPASPSVLGTPVVFTATISGASGAGQTLNGTVTFTDSLMTFNNNTVAVTTNGVTANATYTANALPQGVNAITAVFTPSNPTLVNTSTGTLNQEVQGATALTVTSAPNPSVYGTLVTFTVGIPTVGAAGATGNVIIKFAPVGGGTAPASLTAALSGNPAAGTATTATLPVGSYNVTATYAGDTNYAAATATLASPQVVTQLGTLTELGATPNPGIVGNSIAITATVTPTSGTTTPTGTVTLTDTFNGATVTLANAAALVNGVYTLNTATLAAGTHSLTANYSGTADDAASTAALSLVINQPSTTTTVTAAPAAPIAGTPVVLTATVVGSAGSVIPAGAVTFTDTFNGATVTLGGGAVNLNAKGVATVNVASFAPGTHSIVASYAGDTDDAASSGTLSLVVAAATTSVAVTAAPNPATVQATITFTATVTGNGVMPTGTVNFLANGTTALGTGTLNATGIATVTNNTLAAGSYQITAVYNGDANNAPTTSAAITEVVGLIPTNTTLSTAATTGANAQTILVSTVQNNGVLGTAPTGTVTFTSGTTTVGTATLNVDGVATLTPNLTAGTYTIVASYGGDSIHAPSQSTPISITTYGTSFNLVVTPATVSLPTGQNATVTVTLTSVSGFTDTIGLGCGSLPAGVNCHFSNIAVPLAPNGTATAQLTIDTNNPLGGGATATIKQPGQRNFELAGLFLPFSFFLGWILWRFRKRHANVLSTVLILVLSGAALLATGCIGFTQNSAAAGTYTIQVVGVGQHSDVTQYQNVTLTITQ